MKRRTFGLLATTSLAALKTGFAYAQSAADPSLLTTTLTPLGSERAGNADGTIPAWTGGYTTIPAGWTSGQSMPDFFADEQPVLTIDASNMAQHADKLSDGVKIMMTKYGFSINVYPTHRTAAAPQGVYDNIAKNVTRAQLDPRGPQWGFNGAFGGIPFPIPDITDPVVGGAQIIWNHVTRWKGYAVEQQEYIYVVNDGGATLSASDKNLIRYPYYHPGLSPETFGGLSYQGYAYLNGPANFDGQQSLNFQFTNFALHTTEGWSVLAGQGRVRKTPNVAFDTPSQFLDGVINYDEYQLFSGSLEKYDWKYVGKKEIYIPYNNNGVALSTAEALLLPHFLDPKLVRWELHRCWVVDATLHPGERNVLARRLCYVDEDTYVIMLIDTWDANNNLFHVGHAYNFVRPDLPGTITLNAAVYNLQNNNYGVTGGVYDQKNHPSVTFHDWLPDKYYDPQYMVASSQY